MLLVFFSSKPPLFRESPPEELPPEERVERLKALGEPERLGRLPEAHRPRKSLGPPQRRTRANTVRPGARDGGGLMVPFSDIFRALRFVESQFFLRKTPRVLPVGNPTRR